MSGNRNTECTQSGCRQVALPGCSINELKEKEVINISDGARLGFICDIEAYFIPAE